MHSKVILQILHVLLRSAPTVCIYLSIYHVRYHHDAIAARVRELQWKFSCLNVISQHHGLRTIWLLLDQSDFRRLGATPSDVVPVSNIDFQVYGDSNVIGDVVLTDVCDVVHLVGHTGGGMVEGVASDWVTTMPV